MGEYVGLRRNVTKTPNFLFTQIPYFNNEG